MDIQGTSKGERRYRRVGCARSRYRVDYLMTKFLTTDGMSLWIRPDLTFPSLIDGLTIILR